MIDSKIDTSYSSHPQDFFKGVISALITPFSNQSVDYQSIENLVNFQVKNGIQGFVINGTTAESPTLNWSEVSQIFKLVRSIVGANFPLILGTGSNSTEKTIANNLKAQELGADATLVVVPYYNKPPQRGLLQHFKSVADASTIPMVLYNVPGRTITSMNQDVILELSEHKNIIGIKEASGDLAFAESLKNKLEFKNNPKKFILLSGDDPTYLPFLKLGGHGVISVMSNIMTEVTVQWTSLVQSGKYDLALESFKKYEKLIQLMYCEANPIPLKWMLYKKGLIRSPELRLPLVQLDKKFESEITLELQKTGLI